jgi:hypothetical protein
MPYVTVNEKYQDTCDKGCGGAGSIPTGVFDEKRGEQIMRTCACGGSGTVEKVRDRHVWMSDDEYLDNLR